MPKDKNYGEEIDIKKYQNEDSVSLGEMNFGLWLSEKRVLLTRILIGILILISAGFFIYSAYQFYIYSKDTSDKAPVVANVSSPHNLTKDLIIEAPQYIKSGDRYDLLVKITNPNDKFSANFDSCFNLNGQEFTCVNSFILPGETKYIFALGKAVSDDIKTLTYNTKNVVWQRIDAHAILDWPSFSADRLNFSYTNVNFYSISDGNYNSASSGNILEFNAQNLSAYSYYDVPLNIALYEGSQLVSVNTYHLQNFLSGETRNIKINWPGNLSNVRAEIVPNLNILDDSVYLKYQGSKTS